MRMLVKHAGAFVPNIQRYVTGLESFTKRLGVIIVEDSAVPVNQAPQTILSLLAGSLLAQRVRGWFSRPRPPNSVVSVRSTGTIVIVCNGY